MTLTSVVVAGLFIVLLAVGMLVPGPFTSNECALEVRPGRGTSALEAVQYFSSDYTTARRSFLDAAHAIDLQVQSIQNPNPGPRGEELFTDVVLIGPADASTILVVSSGVHGVEGFAGSGVQTGLLRNQIDRQLPQGMAILMIHAVNPYGMAHLRRFNEDNIDLNRNFRDHSSGYPVNEGYQTLAEFIAPESLAAWKNLEARLGFLWYRVVHGKVALQQAISGGQYDHPKGLFYGGREETWSNRMIRMIVSRYLAQTRRVVLIDLHTGLGPFAAAEVIISEKETSAAYARAVDWWGKRVKNTLTGESVSVPIEGPLKVAFSRMQPGAEVTAVSLEFGTYPAKDVFWSLRAENWLHHHGGPDHEKGEEIKSCLLQAFRPASEEWEVSVWNQGREVVYQVMAGMSR